MEVDLENTVDGEAIHIVIHAILPLFALACDKIYCVDDFILQS